MLIDHKLLSDVYNNTWAVQVAGVAETSKANNSHYGLYPSLPILEWSVSSKG